MSKKNDPQMQADRLLAQYDIRGALKAATKNAEKAVSDEQEDFWERVAELVVETCDHKCHVDDERTIDYCPNCGDWL